MDILRRSRAQRKADIMDALLDIYRDSPSAGASETARRLSIGRSTLYTYLDELEEAGRITRNGAGVKVGGHDA